MTVKDLYKGGVITVYSRQLTVADYGDNFTKNAFETGAAGVCVSVAPAALSSMGRIMDAITGSGLSISELRLLPDGLQLKITGESSADVWGSLAPQINDSLGAGSVHTADGDTFAAALPKPTVAELDTSSLLLVRAHAIKAGALGRIVDQVLGSGFEILNGTMLQDRKSVV